MLCESLEVSIHSFIHQWLYSPSLGRGRFFTFIMLCIVSRTPWTEYQPVARPLPTHRTTQTQNKRTQTSMPLVGFEPTTPVFEQARTVHTLDSAAIKPLSYIGRIIVLPLITCVQFASVLLFVWCKVLVPENSVGIMMVQWLVYGLELEMVPDYSVGIMTVQWLVYGLELVLESR
jgi:hypothetical protein